MNDGVTRLVHARKAPVHARQPLVALLFATSSGDVRGRLIEADHGADSHCAVERMEYSLA